jgi:Carbonic anhydrase
LRVFRKGRSIYENQETASLEYAAEHLHVPLVVVMGHTHCGAVSAALEGGTLPGKLPNLMAAIRPAVDQSAHEPGDRLDNAVRDNSCASWNSSVLRSRCSRISSRLASCASSARYTRSRRARWSGSRLRAVGNQSSGRSCPAALRSKTDRLFGARPRVRST